jgi:hypothetical protein
MHEPFGWTESTTQSVNWDGFSAAYKTCFKQRKFAFKFCMGLLPTGKTGHQQESRFDDADAPPASVLKKATLTSFNALVSADNHGEPQPRQHSASNTPQAT